MSHDIWLPPETPVEAEISALGTNVTEAVAALQRLVLAPWVLDSYVMVSPVSRRSNGRRRIVTWEASTTLGTDTDLLAARAQALAARTGD